MPRSVAIALQFVKYRAFDVVYLPISRLPTYVTVRDRVTSIDRLVVYLRKAKQATRLNKELRRWARSSQSLLEDWKEVFREGLYPGFV